MSVTSQAYLEPGDNLTTPDERAGSERPSHEYYSDSIEQKVRSQSAMSATSYYQGSTNSYGLSPGAGFADQHSLMRLSFEMWVSLPNQMDQALHTYTRLQSSSSTLGPIQLEDMKGWRSSFPSLRPVVETWSPSEQCDIILLEASFQLMSDFPPKFSKLGISLELDFLHPSGNNGGSLATLSEWTCMTHMFQHGRLDKKLAHGDCHVSGLGKVKPFFESKWWASTFTQLTEKRKMAEDSKSDAAIGLANETSRNFFRGLTVMQEIYADTMTGGMSNGIYTDPVPRRKRMAILLWKFSQAPIGYVGTMTWQKLLVSPDRPLESSPAPLFDMSLPPLAMDTIVENGQDEYLFSAGSGFMNGSGHEFNMFGGSMDSELCQDAFLNYKPETLSGFDALHSTFDMPPPSTTISQDLGLSFNNSGQVAMSQAEQANPTTANFFELPPQLQRRSSTATSVLAQQSQHSSFHDSDNHLTHQPLANFDMNTHQRLQAQLGADDLHQHTSPTLIQTQRTPSIATPSLSHHSHHSPVDADDEALRIALLAASAMTDLNPRSSHSNSNGSFALTASSASQPMYTSTNPFAMSPPARPQLHTAHSFAGIPTSNHNLQPHSHVRNHSRHTSFERTLANLQAFTENQDMTFPFNMGEDSTHAAEALAIAEEITRPASQPTIPVAKEMAEDVYDELHALHGGMPVGLEESWNVLDTPRPVGRRVEEDHGQGVERDEGLGGSFVVVKEEDGEL